MAKAATEKINWTEGLVVETFGLRREFHNVPILTNWLDVQHDQLTETEIAALEKRRWRLIENVNGWNEETLKMKFIAFLLEMVDYDEFKPFQGVFETELSGVVQGKALKVITDYTIAKVTLDFVTHPYFYFHEYKPKKRTKDAVAQILLAMLLAQEQNKDDKPIYGCVVFGELWQFVVMHGSEYCISEGYRATSEKELQQILLVLRKFKHILLTELSLP
jgi:hypothetical protein